MKRMNEGIRCGVHTIELTTKEPILFENLHLKAYRAIKAISGKRYHFNLPKYTGTEYLPTDKTEQAISEALEVCRDRRGGLPLVTRIDWRVDSYSATYRELLPIMRPFVYVFAYRYGLYDRRLETTKGIGGEPETVRAMPEEKTDEPRGIEYYNKPLQAKDESYGKARLELRRLNLNGESLSSVIEMWRRELQQITKADYMAMLEAHARELYQNHFTAGNRIGAFIRDMRPFLIGKEQERMLYQLADKTPQRRKTCEGLPRWKDVEQAIHQVITLLRK